MNTTIVLDAALKLLANTSKGVNMRINDLGEVDEPCTIVTSIDERSEGTTVYGYKDTPKSQVTRNSIPLMIEHNKELARRLYCGKVWTCDALKFAETYYEHRDN